MEEGEVTEERGGGAPALALVGKCGTDRGRDETVDAARTAAGEHAQARAWHHVVIKVTDGQARRGPEESAVGQRRGEVAGESGLQRSPRGWPRVRRP